MSVYTYTDARQNLAQILDEAKGNGEVFIKRKNGQMFKVLLVQEQKSGLDVPGVNVDISTNEVVDLIRSMRER